MKVFKQLLTSAGHWRHCTLQTALRWVLVFYTLYCTSCVLTDWWWGNQIFDSRMFLSIEAWYVWMQCNVSWTLYFLFAWLHTSFYRDRALRHLKKGCTNLARLDVLSCVNVTRYINCTTVVVHQIYTTMLIFIINLHMYCCVKTWNLQIFIGNHKHISANQMST